MRQSTMALVLLTVAVGVGLFLAKYRVQGLEDQLQALNQDIARDRERIQVLRAEWSHFNEPNRLRALAGRHLDMIPVQSEQFIERGQVENNLPKRPKTLTSRGAAKNGNNAGKELQQ